ncbi:hypothetical protein B0A52_01060 [Exophiala mesophila]|uniref:Major facilitator superfamily (MFS) profile domain-containing protein n=1 Tax=Exophiala mesophila TaxID=212818 RepID=A0A438NGC8_EXOME|nr:hypothetical protein B0A52_01060 [Exophiala mesophila]
MSSPKDIEKNGGHRPGTDDTYDAPNTMTTTNTIPEPVPGEPLELTPSKHAAGNSFLSRTISRVRTKDSIDPGPPPDGGTHAWFMACLAHLVIFNIWGLVNSFGIFQVYYVQVMQIGDESSVAWIGTVQTFVLYLIGTFSGRGLDAGFFGVQMWVGSLLYVLGMFLLSLCTTYWQVFLAQAICMGIGYGMVFVPTLALTSTYFLKRRSIALAIAVTGSCSGGLVFPAIAERMLPRAGFGWTVRTMAFVMLVLAIISASFLKPRLPPRKSGPIVEWAAFKEGPYAIYVLGGFLYFWSVYIGFYFVGSFGRDALGTSQSTSLSLIMVLNGVGLIGRVLPNYAAQQWFGPLNTVIPITFAASIVLFSWIAVNTVTGLWIFATFYGLTAAGIQGLFPVVLTSLTTDQKKAGVRAGMAFSVVGFAVLTGAPIAGALIAHGEGSYFGLQLFSAIVMLAAACVLLWTRYAVVGWHKGML